MFQVDMYYQVEIIIDTQSKPKQRREIIVSFKLCTNDQIGLNDISSK